MSPLRPASRDTSSVLRTSSPKGEDCGLGISWLRAAARFDPERSLREGLVAGAENRTKQNPILQAFLIAGKLWKRP